MVITIYKDMLETHLSNDMEDFYEYQLRIGRSEALDDAEWIASNYKLKPASKAEQEILLDIYRKDKKTSFENHLKL